MLYLDVVLVLVTVGRKTPLLNVVEVVLVLFLFKHDAGMVKQQGIVLVDVLEGSNTPE